MATERGLWASWHTQRLWSRLWLAAVGRPWWQRLAATAVSLWWLLWVADRFGPGAVRRTPLGVVHSLITWTGVHGPTRLDGVIDWLHAPVHRGFLAAAAWLAGACWAAARELTIAPAVLGWVVVLTASEGLGYDAAAARAGGGFAVVVLILLALSLPLRKRTVVRRARLLPMDVLLGAGKAAALCVLVVGFAVIRAVGLVCAPYLPLPSSPAQVPDGAVPEPAPPADEVAARNTPPQRRDPVG